MTGRARFALGDLGPGEYTLEARLEDGQTVEGELTVSGGGREEYHGRRWGLSGALYAMRSRNSWGIGDFADLADVAVTVARAGGDYLLLTPLVSSVQQEVQRLGFAAEGAHALVVDPMYIRPEDIRETVYLPSAQRTMLEWSSEPIREVNSQPDPINFDDVWEAKRAALEVIYSGQRSVQRENSFISFLREHETSLGSYAHAMVARDVGPDVYEDLRADSSTGAAARREHHERIEFYLWLQWVARQQLTHAQNAARAAGMSIGFIHTIETGTPEVNELGAFGGGIMIPADHPDAAGLTAAAGSLEVFAGGEVPGAKAYATLRQQFSLPEPVEATMIAVADVADPPTAGALALEHLALARRLGALAGDYEQMRKDERMMNENMLQAAREAGVLSADATERQTVESLYQFLAHTPAQYLTITFSDAVGNRRPFVLGGNYPDWAYPYADGAGEAVMIDELPVHARFNSLLVKVDSELRAE